MMNFKGMVLKDIILDSHLNNSIQVDNRPIKLYKIHKSCLYKANCITIDCILRFPYSKTFQSRISYLKNEKKQR